MLYILYEAKITFLFFSYIYIFFFFYICSNLIYISLKKMFSLILIVYIDIYWQDE